MKKSVNKISAALSSFVLAVCLLSTAFIYNSNAYANGDTTLSTLSSPDLSAPVALKTVSSKPATSRPVTSRSVTSRPVLSMLEKRHQNVVLQQWELSCAAAALATILRYQHGLPVTERLVALDMIKRKEYLVNPDLLRIRQGFSLLDLKRYVDNLGYEGRGLGQLTFADLVAHAPIIVPVITRGYPHFVVFRGATSNTVLIADPAFGNVTMPTYKFKDSWIKYKDINHVGFVVMNSGELAPPGRLSAHALDFVTSN